MQATRFVLLISCFTYQVSLYCADANKTENLVQIEVKHNTAGPSFVLTLPSTTPFFEIVRQVYLSDQLRYVDKKSGEFYVLTDNQGSYAANDANNVVLRNIFHVQQLTLYFMQKPYRSALKNLEKEIKAGAIKTDPRMLKDLWKQPWGRKVLEDHLTKVPRTQLATMMEAYCKIETDRTPSFAQKERKNITLDSLIVGFDPDNIFSFIKKLIEK